MCGGGGGGGNLNVIPPKHLHIFAVSFAMLCLMLNIQHNVIDSDFLYTPQI